MGYRSQQETNQQTNATQQQVNNTENSNNKNSSTQTQNTNDNPYMELPLILRNLIVVILIFVS